MHKILMVEDDAAIRGALGRLFPEGAISAGSGKFSEYPGAV